MFLNLLKNLHYLLLFSYVPNDVFRQHFIRGILYISFLAVFRYTIFFKCNYELRAFKEQGMSLHYLRLDKAGDVYRFGVGQFFENLTVNRIYNNRNSLIDIDKEKIYEEYGKVFYICFWYCLMSTAGAMLLSYLLAYIGFMPAFMLKYIFIILIGKNALTFITSFRIVNDSIAKYPINVLINMFQVFGPMIIYLYIYPIFNLQINFLNYAITSSLVNLISFVAYYISVSSVLGKFLKPSRVDMNIYTVVRDFNYLLYTITKNMIIHVLVDIFLITAGSTMDAETKVNALYLISSGLRNIVGTFETPMDWVGRVFISRYRDTKHFIAASYLILLSYFLMFGTLFAYLISSGIYNYIMVIKFDNISYFHLAFATAVMSVFCKVWETTVVVQRKDLYPVITLFTSAIVYFIVASILVHIFKINPVLSLFYATMSNWFTQYLMFVLRGFFLLQIPFKHLIYEFIRYIIVLSVIYQLSKLLIINQ